MATQTESEVLDLWPRDHNRLQELEDALLAAGSQPPSKPLPEWTTVRERPAWRAFLARWLGI